MSLIAAAITGSGLLTQNSSLTDSLEHKLWIRGADICRAEEDIFQGMEGKGANSLIDTELTTQNGNGLTAIYPLVAEFGNSPVQGGDRFDVTTNYDDIEIGSDKVNADYHRFGTSNDDRAEEVLGMRNQLLSKINELQGRQMGKWQCHHALMTCINKVNAENVINPKGVTGQDNMLSTDTLDFDNVVRGKAMMAPMGGLPFSSGKDESGNEIRSYMVIATVNATTGLKNDSTYRELVKFAQDRGGDNPLWSGKYPRVDGNIIREWDVIDQPGAIKAGSPLNPHAYNGTAIASGTGALTLTGGRKAANAAKTSKMYFADFPLYAFPFQKNDTLSWSSPVSWTLNGSGNFYVTIVNPASAATDPDKWGLYEISANNGNELTVATRLGANNNGIRRSTVGSVTWDSAVNTDVHPEGALIYLSTGKGVPLGITLMLGAAGLRRAWGKYKMALAYNNVIEGGFIKEQYTMSVFGHAPKRDLDKRVPGIIAVRHAISYEGWNHPTPTV